MQRTSHLWLKAPEGETAKGPCMLTLDFPREPHVPQLEHSSYHRGAKNLSYSSLCVKAAISCGNPDALLATSELQRLHLLVSDVTASPFLFPLFLQGEEQGVLDSIFNCNLPIRLTLDRTFTAYVAFSLILSSSQMPLASPGSSACFPVTPVILYFKWPQSRNTTSVLVSHDIIASFQSTCCCLQSLERGQKTLQKGLRNPPAWETSPALRL